MKHFRNPDAVHAPLAQYTHQIEVSGIERFLVTTQVLFLPSNGG